MEKLREGKGVPHAHAAAAAEPSRAVSCVRCLVLSRSRRASVTWRGTRVVNKKREENGIWPLQLIVSFMAINCDWLPGAYIFHTHTLFPSLRDTHSVFSLPVELTSARTEIGRTGLRNPTPCIETPTRVCGQSGFWGESSATAHRRDRLLPLRRIEINYSVFVFFLVDVRGTALRTSSCIDCGPLLRATHYID